MMTRSGFVWCVLAVCAALAAFTVKYQVRDLEEQLTSVEGRIATAREDIHVLKAEWSYLNRPERLAELAARHLDLGPMVPTQMGALLDVPLRLPEADGLEAPAAADDGTGTLVTFRVEQP